MFKGTVLCVPRSEAIRRAAHYLQEVGITVTQRCAPDVTHMLLPIPSFSSGEGYLAHLLNKLPEDVIISGGNLNTALLADYRTVDFLQDPYYLADNAAITADCALQIMDNRTSGIFLKKKVLIIGWGRIGKCLGQKLRDRDADITIAARKASDLAMIQALGYSMLHSSELEDEIPHYDIIINTVPVLLVEHASPKPDALILELASKPGIAGENIINARGLPGIMAPERSGKLIAETFLRLSI